MEDVSVPILCHYDGAGRGYHDFGGKKKLILVPKNAIIHSFIEKMYQLSGSRPGIDKLDILWRTRSSDKSMISRPIEDQDVFSYFLTTAKDLSYVGVVDLVMEANRNTENQASSLSPVFVHSPNTNDYENPEEACTSALQFAQSENLKITNNNEEEEDDTMDIPHLRFEDEGIEEEEEIPSDSAFLGGSNSSLAGENPAQLTLSFQGQTYIFDSVSAEKVQEVLLLLGAYEIPQAMSEVTVQNAKQKDRCFDKKFQNAARKEVAPRCTHRGISSKSIPMMRRGPVGPRSLCNACGLHWQKKCLCFFFLFSFSEAREFLVGGKTDSWKIPSSPSSQLNEWSKASRFNIGDTIVWKYDSKNDSVFQVTKSDYANCNVSSPIAQYNDGNTTVKLEKPGPYYFIDWSKGTL
ncbi:hypothetical protein IFM89_034678 [Coptis chinensis]|uniref:Uncharacterized protein n=1 Tax=Coptis chinensis TaxID=261450 RepID=A0A835HPX5_9MAGN|nr:hypothetical protein IFM89_034678 [Coptis chinensis]